MGRSIFSTLAMTGPIYCEYIWIINRSNNQMQNIINMNGLVYIMNIIFFASPIYCEYIIAGESNNQMQKYIVNIFRLLLALTIR